MYNSELASETSKLLDHRRVLFIPNFRKNWIFLPNIWNFRKFGKICSNQYRTAWNCSSNLIHCEWWISDNTDPFWTCHSSRNLVDGLPLAIHFTLTRPYRQPGSSLSDTFRNDLYARILTSSGVRRYLRPPELFHINSVTTRLMLQIFHSVNNNIQHFCRINMDRTCLWSSMFDLCQADPGASMCCVTQF